MIRTARLLVDIGGTSIRFAWRETGGELNDVRIYRTADFPSMETAIRTYLRNCPVMPGVAALATANPVQGDTVRMTNLAFSFSAQEIRRALDLDALLIVNDFTALALGVPHLAHDDRQPIGPELAGVPGPIGIIGPGTGLGVSALIPTQTGWQALSSEGGHATCAPADAFEAELLRAAWQRHTHVSFERLLSGPGLRLLYELVCAAHGTLPQPATPAEITQQAQDGTCLACQQAVTTFCNLLATAAGNLALTLGARGGIYIGGGIVPRLGTLLDPVAFRSRFEAHGRLGEYLARVPTTLITAPYAALTGLDALLTAWLTHGRQAPLPFDLVLVQR
ncbi:glucokinase [Imbroritus primus]|uniref:glucokinase n=1 Tax=Imbroritus primus TaxID=3058603 RepID=UPI003D161D6A